MPKLFKIGQKLAEIEQFKHERNKKTHYTPQSSRDKLRLHEQFTITSVVSMHSTIYRMATGHNTGNILPQTLGTGIELFWQQKDWESMPNGV